MGSDAVKLLYNIHSYKAFYNCYNNYRAGGVLCFIKDPFDVDVLNVEIITADV